MESPEVPPRPARRSDRSVSRDRDYARSPLNDSPFATSIPSSDVAGNQLRRPPSVSTMPSIGQEGMEYASLSPNTAATSDLPHPPASPSHTRNVAGDLPLHAPKATVSTIAAANQVAPVTRTDSVDAAGIGIGKAKTDYDPSDPTKPPSSSRAYQYRPPSAVSNERPPSTKAESFYEDEHHHRIPEIGLQAPLNPMAGDVQAPSPALPMPGNRESLSRQGTREHHNRRRSAQGHHLPPGSYGLHGHGIASPDDLEKAWYQKHPDEMAKEEHGAYGPGASATRGEWVMSSEDLNRLVRQTSQLGLTKAMPTEDGAYQVATKSLSQQHSPDLAATDLPQRPPSTQHLVPESPLRRSMYSRDDDTTDDDEAGDNKRLNSRFAGMYAAGDEHREMDEYGTPILAPDELAKNPAWEYMKPAVSPDFSRARDVDEHLRSGQRSGSNSRASSRPSSRPNSIHGHHGLSRFISHDHHHEDVHTPLEEIEEYEPLFKDDDDSVKKDPLDRFKSREGAGGHLQRFPSQDIWEDTPSSLQLHTTVGSGEEPEESSEPMKKTTSLFEHPDQERARRGEPSEDQRRDFLQDYLSKHNKSLQKQQRPGMGQKFPSRDIWEDTPDSLRLETTIASSPPQQAVKSPPGITAKPVIPPRPAKTKDVSPTDKKTPTIPDRPKPQVPPRPARKSGDDQPEGSTGDKSGQSATSPPATKPKPAIPSNKFANRAGFLNDLNSRLQSGPPAPKPRDPEPSSEEEKAPLSDARKGRARGPQRRKPAEPSPDATVKDMPRPVPFFSIVQPWTVWSIPEEAEDVSVTTTSTQNSASLTKTAKDIEEAPEVSPLATNTAGERLQRNSNAPSTMSGALAHPSNAEMDARARAEEEATKKALQQHEIDRVGAYGDLPGPVVEQPNPLEGVPSPPPDAELAKGATREAEGTSGSKTQDAPLRTITSDDAGTEVDS